MSTTTLSGSGACRQWTKDELPPTGAGTNWATLSDRPSLMDDGADSRLVNEGD